MNWSFFFPHLPFHQKMATVTFDHNCFVICYCSCEGDEQVGLLQAHAGYSSWRCLVPSPGCYQTGLGSVGNFCWWSLSSATGTLQVLQQEVHATIGKEEASTLPSLLRFVPKTCCSKRVLTATFYGAFLFFFIPSKITKFLFLLSM